MLVKNALSRKKAILNLIFSEGCTMYSRHGASWGSTFWRGDFARIKNSALHTVAKKFGNNSWLKF